MVQENGQSQFGENQFELKLEMKKTFQSND